MLKILVWILIFGLSACAKPPAVITWLPHELWWQEAFIGQGKLNRLEGHLVVDPTHARNIHQVSEHWKSKIIYQLGIYDSSDINAFVSRDQTLPTIYLTLGLIERWGHDSAALAYVIAHEVAHLKLNHYQYNPSEQESQANILGLIAGLIIPIGGLIGGPSTLALQRQANRQTEEEADNQAFEWLDKSPYGLCGAQRVLTSELKHANHNYTTWFQTHPSYEKRLDSLKSKYFDQLKRC